MDDDQLTRYSRHILLDEIGIDGQQRLLDSRVLLVGMRVPPNYGSDYEHKFRLVYETTAKTQRVPLVPFLFEGFAADRTMFQSDGIHPTIDAQEKMLDNIWPRLRPLLTSLPAKKH